MSEWKDPSPSEEGELTNDLLPEVVEGEDGRVWRKVSEAPGMSAYVPAPDAGWTLRDVAWAVVCVVAVGVLLFLLGLGILAYFYGPVAI